MYAALPTALLSNQSPAAPQPYPGPPPAVLRPFSPPPPPYPWERQLYRVRVIEHTGAAIMWFQQSRVIIGTYPQCLAAIAAAQNHCLTAGWWSPGSALAFNWLALAANRKSRQTLNALAARDGWPIHRDQAPAAG